MTKFKIQKNDKIQMAKHKFSFCNLSFFICAYFGFCALLFVITPNVYALNIDKVKIYFLEGDYKSAISEGEKILANESGRNSGLDELYYLLGISYLKDGNYLRASDIFDIIIKEFNSSKFNEEAKLGLGDSYFLNGDFNKAKECYSELLNTNPQSKFKSIVLSRLNRIEQKDASAPYYSVQVGFFSNPDNANNLYKKLNSSGYNAYIEEEMSPDSASKNYRVKVGRLSSRSEAVDLQNKLVSEGYSTKISP